MNQDGRSIRRHAGKMNPLFIELYLSSNSDDAEEERRAAIRGRRLRNKPQKQVNRA